MPGWDGVSDFYEDDPGPEEMAYLDWLRNTHPPDAVTGEEYDPEVVHERARRRLVEWERRRGR